MYPLSSRKASLACGMHLTHVVKRKNGRAYRYYTWLGAQKRGWDTCPTKSVPAQEIEDFAVGRVREMGRDPALIEETVKQARGLRAARGPELEAEHARLRDELTGVRAEIRTLVEAFGRTGSDSAAVTERIAELETRAGQTERRMTEVREHILAIERETLDAGRLIQAYPSRCGGSRMDRAAHALERNTPPGLSTGTMLRIDP